MSTADGLGSIMTLISLARCPSQTRTVRVCWSMSAMATGPARWTCATVRHSVLPEGKRQRLSRVPHSFRPARLTVVPRRETYFPKA